MMKKTLLLMLAVLVCSAAVAQDINFPDLPGYKKNTSFPVFQPDNLWDFINGAAENYLAYGFEDLHIAEYKKGKNTIKLEVYRHADHTLAFGIYSTERSPSFSYLNLGSQGYSSDGTVNFFKGSYYVKIRTYSKNEKTIKDAGTLASIVAGTLEGKTDMPAILTAFPAEGKKLNGEMYINQSVLGHKFLNNAFKADYASGPDEFSLFVLDYKSSEETLKAAGSLLSAAGQEVLEASEGKYVFPDGYNGTLFLGWKGTRMVIISGLSKDQAGIADRYTSALLK
jgi:hypothetical protein